MGLDTTHDCWHGSYGAFGRFRDDVAAAALARYGYAPNYKSHPKRAFYGWWDDDHPYIDILDVFFVHSDCEGYIFPEHAEELADRLDALVFDVDDDGTAWSHRQRLHSFVRGLRAAAAAADEWEIVRFY